MKTSDFPLSRILSYIFHPLLIPNLAISTLMLWPNLYSIVLPNMLKIWFISVVFIFTVAIPSIGMFILLKVNAIQSVEMKDRSERTVPLLISCTSFMALLYVLKTTNFPPVFLYMLYSATFALLIGLLINLIYKISLHTLGWGALSATLISISLRIGMSLLLPIVVSALIAGLVGYARLKQNAHNQAEIYLGYVAGVSVIVFIAYFI